MFAMSTEVNTVLTSAVRAETAWAPVNSGDSGVERSLEDVRKDGVRRKDEVGTMSAITMRTV